MYRISCPSVFQDDTQHIIESYWEDLPEKPGRERLAQCTRVLVDGKEVDVEKIIIDHTLENCYMYFIDIVLDK